jgi:hypothetical protein
MASNRPVYLKAICSQNFRQPIRGAAGFPGAAGNGD